MKSWLIKYIKSNAEPMFYSYGNAWNGARAPTAAACGCSRSLSTFCGQRFFA